MSFSVNSNAKILYRCGVIEYNRWVQDDRPNPELSTGMTDFEFILVCATAKLRGPLHPQKRATSQTKLWYMTSFTVSVIQQYLKVSQQYLKTTGQGNTIRILCQPGCSSSSRSSHSGEHIITVVWYTHQTSRPRWTYGFNQWLLALAIPLITLLWENPIGLQSDHPKSGESLADHLKITVDAYTRWKSNTACHLRKWYNPRSSSLHIVHWLERSTAHHLIDRSKDQG